MTGLTAPSRVGARRVLSGAARDPVVWIFLLVGVVEVLATDPRLHTLLLFAVAGVLALDATGVLGRTRGVPIPPAGGHPEAGATPGRPRQRRVLLVVAGAAYALAAGLFPRFSYPVTLAVGLPAAAALVWAWRTPAPGGVVRGQDPRGVWAWAGLFFAGAIWELVAFGFQPGLTRHSAAHPTISALVDPVFAHAAGRGIGIGVWLAIGWLLLRAG